MIKQTLFKAGHHKLEFYEGDTAGTYCWDLMYRDIVLADGKNRLFASLSAAKNNFKSAQKAMAKFDLSPYES